MTFSDNARSNLLIFNNAFDGCSQNQSPAMRGLRLFASVIQYYAIRQNQSPAMRGLRRQLSVVG